MSITSYKLSVGADAIDDMRQRISSTRWPSSIANTENWDRGVPLGYLQKLAGYWHDSFRWDLAEAEINRFEQHLFTFEGQQIHFFHVRAKTEPATPLLLLHGWPSSGLEYLRLMTRLTDGHFGAKCFHLVIPTIPGFGLSPPPSETGWHSPRMARALSALMKELGYPRYGIHGSDIGGDIMNELAFLDSYKVIGTHQANDTRTATISAAMFMGGGNPADNPALSREQREQVLARLSAAEDDMAYLKQQSTRPFTLGYALADSPIGQLAWVLEKFKEWTGPSAALPEDKLDIDQLLATVTLYWLTGAGHSSACYIYDNMKAPREWDRIAKCPRGYAIFESESFVRTLVDSNRTAQHWSDFVEGGHFPAMEVPELLAADISEFFSKLLG